MNGAHEHVQNPGGFAPHRLLAAAGRIHIGDMQEAFRGSWLTRQIASVRAAGPTPAGSSVLPGTSSRADLSAIRAHHRFTSRSTIFGAASRTCAGTLRGPHALRARGLRAGWLFCDETVRCRMIERALPTRSLDPRPTWYRDVEPIVNASARLPYRRHRAVRARRLARSPLRGSCDAIDARDAALAA
jgi:hypothetical protein